MVLDGGVWADEWERWAPDLDVTLVPYSSITQRVKTEKGGSRPVGKLRLEYRTHWDTVILDEAHYIKGRTTTWTEAVLRLSTDRMMLATGTPVPNWAHELFISLKLLHPEESHPGGEFGSYWRWVNQWFEVTPSRWNPQAKEIGTLKACVPGCNRCQHWVDFHRANLGDLFLQRLRDDVLTDLPPLTGPVYLQCKMGAAQSRLYRQLKKDFIAWTESGAEVVAWNKAALSVKLAKVVTGVQLVDPASVGSAKLDALVSNLEGQAQPALVVAHFQSACEMARDALRAAGKKCELIYGPTSRADRLRFVRAFQSGDLDVLVGSLDVISEGLTLTRADTVHFLERSWRPFKNEQALRRIHRIGQDRPVTAYVYVTSGTIDDRMTDLLATKTEQELRSLRPHQIAALL
jgi:SNF2 family DNA or RNA helicase